MSNIQEVLEQFAQGNFEEAFTLCNALLAKNPTDIEAIHLLGLIYAKTGHINKAVAQFKQAISLDPSQAIFHNNISNAYKILGELGYAKLHLTEALRLAPNNAESCNNLGSLHYTQGSIAEAIPLFEKAIRLNPNSFEAHYNLANCFVKQDLILQAISHYETVLKLKPSHNYACLNLGLSYVMVHDYKNALPYLEKALEYSPDAIEVEGHLADAYLNEGITDKAIIHFKSVVTKDPNRADWQHNLAVLYLRANDKENAKVHFAKALTLDPNNGTAKHMLSALNAENIKTAPQEYVQKLFDQYATYYDQHVKQTLKYNVPQLLREHVNKFITHFTTQQNILDLGCGTGICGVYFRDLARFLVGVDLSSAMLEQASILGAYDALCCCDILESIPGQAQEYFELVLAADVFVYIGELDVIFSNINSCLKNNGLLAFSVEEHLNSDSYKVQTSGRFAHSQQYILELANKYNFHIEVNEEITPRIQNGESVKGRLFILRKK